MAYLDGLRYIAPGVGANLSETRAGVPLYSGTAFDLPEWRFRVTTKRKAIDAMKADERGQKLADLVSKVTDALTDEALRIAMDIGEDTLSKPNGIDTLIKAIEEHVMQFKDDEARDLFHAGTRMDGPLARQPGEPMTGYIARRRRWLQRLQSLDGETKVSENILAD